ncbi:MAG: gfo/Idh/MocA family oxidoreductase [Planctomycetota bacterium]|nr:MAG: gfo/Idh/MocA family oxidoreductase [Planctomycetota bacterium]
MNTRVCRWGILGTAGIARKNWKAIRLSGNCEVTAVASRNMDAAQRFIDECSAQVPPGSVPTAVGSYEELLQRDDVDAVYIPLPTALRHQWVIRAAEAGKHVIGEKPAALNATQVAEMLDACRDNGVQYMDGVMFMHSQRLPLVRTLLDDPQRIGKLRRMACQFSFAGDEEFRRRNIRTHSELEPYGCLGDLGWYCTRIFLWIMQGQMPVEVRARTLSHLQGDSSPEPVPGEFSAELLFPDGVSATFYNSFVTENQQWFHVSGDRGYLRVHDFVLPFHDAEVDAEVGQDVFSVNNCEFHMEHHLTRHAVREYDAGHDTAQEVRLFRNFAKIVLDGNLDPSWPEWTLKTQRVLDACYQSAARDGSPIPLEGTPRS